MNSNVNIIALLEFEGHSLVRYPLHLLDSNLIQLLAKKCLEKQLQKNVTADVQCKQFPKL